MENLTEEQIIKYARWVYHECDSPISEIEWLVEIIINDDLYPNKKESLTENIKELSWSDVQGENEKLITLDHKKTT